MMINWWKVSQIANKRVKLIKLLWNFKNFYLLIQLNKYSFGIYNAIKPITFVIIFKKVILKTCLWIKQQKMLSTKINSSYDLNTEVLENIIIHFYILSFLYHIRDKLSFFFTILNISFIILYQLLYSFDEKLV